MDKMSHNKWSFAQMTSNSDTGKTSSSGTMGVLTILVGLLSFIGGILTYVFMEEAKTEVMTQSIILITLGTGLLGYRKSQGGAKPPTPPVPPVVNPVNPNDDEDASGGDETKQ